VFRLAGVGRARSRLVRVEVMVELQLEHGQPFVDPSEAGVHPRVEPADAWSILPSSRKSAVARMPNAATVTLSSPTVATVSIPFTMRSSIPGSKSMC
jgi:hypothetical protein